MHVMQDSYERGYGKGYEAGMRAKERLEEAPRKPRGSRRGREQREMSSPGKHSSSSPREPPPLQLPGPVSQGPSSPLQGPAQPPLMQPEQRASLGQAGPAAVPQGWTTADGSPPKPGSRKSDPAWRPTPKDYRHARVPKTTNLEEMYHKKGQDRPPTTLMIRNIPNCYTQRELISELESSGFRGSFDFLYLPVDKGTLSNVGYAFVNFVDHDSAMRCMRVFHHYRFKRHKTSSGKVATVSVAHLQGLEENLKHYERAAVNNCKLKQRRPVVMANISISLAQALGDDDVG